MKNKTKNTLNSLLLIFLLFGSILPINAYTYQEKNDDLGEIIIDIQPKPFNFLENLFGIITISPASALPGQTITVTAGVESSRAFDLSSSYVSVAIGGPATSSGFYPGIYSKDIKPVPSGCAFASCQIKVTFTLPSNLQSGKYLASFRMGDKQGLIDKAEQLFTVSSTGGICPPSTWGSYSDFKATSDGNGIIQSSTRNVYDSSCNLINVERQYFTVCNSGYHINGQSTSITQASGQQSCIATPGVPQTPRCGNGIIDTGEYCDTKLIAGDCKAFGFAGGTLGCKSDCQDYDISQCTGGETKTNDEGRDKESEEDNQTIEKYSSYIIEDWKELTPQSRVKSTCLETAQCESYADLSNPEIEYKVKCIRTGLIKDQLEQDAFDLCKSHPAASFISLIIPVLGKLGISSSCETIDDLQSVQFGACIASPKPTGNFFEEELFKLGDFSVTGLYLIIGIGALILLLSVLPKRN